jgi:hypothetical protein
MRFEDAVIQEAMAKCGNSVQACIDFCLAAQSSTAQSSSQSSTEVVAEVEEVEAAEAFLQLGFSQTSVTRAVEATGFNFPKALQLLLCGNDVVRWKGVDADKRFHRHLRTKVPRIGKLSTASVWEEYANRAYKDLNLDVRVVDLDQMAGQTTAACFWLCLAAGLVGGGEAIRCQSLTALPAISPFLRRAIGQCPTTCHTLGGAAIQNSPLGELAAALRASFCQGPSALLLQPAVMGRLFPAFACLTSNGPPRTLVHYRAWVQKVGFNEYADELILAAVTRELQIRIVVVPRTPSNSVELWAVSSYPDREQGRPDLPIIYMGNDDVHYVCLL